MTNQRVSRVGLSARSPFDIFFSLVHFQGHLRALHSV